jgi:hypothetical protein
VAKASQNAMMGLKLRRQERRVTPSCDEVWEDEDRQGRARD